MTNDGYESLGELIHSIEDTVKNLMKESYKAPKDLYEHWQAFSSAVNWNEDFLKYLLAFHLTLFLFVAISRRNTDIQGVLFIVVAGLVFLAEQLNAWCGDNWRYFSTQNYFDKAGLFIGIFYAAPLLIIATLQLVRIPFIHDVQLVLMKQMDY